MAEDLILSVTGAQINDAVTNGLDKNLSKLSTTGKKVLDGQWIYTNYALVQDGTLDTETYVYDLSSFLPNDGNIYEVGITGWSRSRKNAGGLLSFIYSSEMPRTCGFFAAGNLESTSTISYACTGNIILPVGAERKIRHGVYNGSAPNLTNIWIWGYRRVGTNE